MMNTISIAPGVTLRYFRDARFKQGAFSFQLVRPMGKQEAAMNALLPSVLLRGTRSCPDLRAITQRLDELYGAAVSPLVRRVGDYQTTGFYCAFMDDRFALPGDRVLAPMLSFLGELLLDSPTENGAFLPDFVESEKKNLISTIESDRNDKRLYAMQRLLKEMCAGDSFGLPRLGEPEDVAAITPEGLTAHYREILRTSPMELLYVGSAPQEQVLSALEPLLSTLDRAPAPLPPQTAFAPNSGSDITDTMDVAQGKLCMGFTTPVTNRCEDMPAMQMLNAILGAGMTSKLFLHIRERMSLCYSIDSAYYGSKGILLVNAGIDFDKESTVREEVLRQLQACRDGDITDEEMTAAREAILSSLRAVHDSPGSIESFYATAALSATILDWEGYLQAVEAVTREDVVRCARSLTLNSTYFLKGVQQ
ncbi:MAG: pitrilysin family protein [Candidatus Faecousia sp.]|nr:pitrilysin family protein [Candidatus Faecousia sp.]